MRLKKLRRRKLNRKRNLKKRKIFLSATEVAGEGEELKRKR
jgi:hypothetical protein